jgi:hypothetical protein
MKNTIKISPQLQLEIFETVFLHLVEYPSTRWKLKSMIESRDNVDQAELNLNLRKLELEIIQKGEEV